MRVLERRIAICVDDYGMDAGVDLAVLKLAAAGRVSATSCMTGAPHWREGAARLRELLAPERFDAGLHLDLTEHPLDTRLRKPLEQWLARSYLHLVPRAALRAEIERQLDAFERALGRPPAHVDGHQHLHQLPVVRKVLLSVLDARYPGRRPWLRSTRRPVGEPARKARVIEALGGRAWVRAATERGYRLNGHLLGVYDFRGDAERYLALLEDWLAGSADGDLLMCHPSLAMRESDPIAPARRNEYEVLSGPEFVELLERHSVRVVPFSRLPV